jgi:DNA mismatch endonuclease (patch repair protein)
VFAVMKRVRSKNISPELPVRKTLFSFSLRYSDYKIRVVCANIVIALLGCQLTVFIDGCFWHRCPDHGTIPK